MFFYFTFSHLPVFLFVIIKKGEIVRSLPRLNLFSFNDNKRSVLLILYMSYLAEFRDLIGYIWWFIKAKWTSREWELHTTLHTLWSATSEPSRSVSHLHIHELQTTRRLKLKSRVIVTLWEEICSATCLPLTFWEPRFDRSVRQGVNYGTRCQSA